MSETLEKTVASSDVVGLAQLTGDRSPIHHVGAFRGAYGVRPPHRPRPLHREPDLGRSRHPVARARCGLYLADAELPRPGADRRHRRGHRDGRRADAGQIRRAPFLPLHGRRRDRARRRGAGQSAEREDCEGSKAGGAVVRERLPLAGEDKLLRRVNPAGQLDFTVPPIPGVSLCFQPPAGDQSLHAGVDRRGGDLNRTLLKCIERAGDDPSNFQPAPGAMRQQHAIDFRG